MRRYMLALLLLALPAYAHEDGKPKMQSSKVTLEGELIDPQCFFTHAGQGPSHAACAVKCAKGGQTLAFLDRKSNRIYGLIASGHGKNPNDGLYGYVGKQVVVKGVLYSHGSDGVLTIQSVSPKRG